MLKFRTSVYGNILVGMEKIKAQSNYCTIKKEILSIILCVDKFQTDLLNQKKFCCFQSIYIYIYSLLGNV